MAAIDRFYQYLNNKNIKPTRFEKDAGLSNGYLGKQLGRKGGLGENILNIIIENCPDLNAFWLLTGRGEMFINTKEAKRNVHEKIDQTNQTPSIEQMKHKIDILEEKIKHLEKESVLKDQIIQLLKNTQKQNDIKH